MKKLNKKGFTLAELLIVVAIIAILVAIAIPVFTKQLEKSRDTTSIANLRAAYAEAAVAVVEYKSNDVQAWKVGNVTSAGTNWACVQHVGLLSSDKNFIKSDASLPFVLSAGSPVASSGYYGVRGFIPGKTDWYVNFSFNPSDGKVYLTASTGEIVNYHG